MRLVFEKSGGVPLKPVAVTELAVAAQALETPGFSPGDGRMAATAAGLSSWAMLSSRDAA